MPVRPVARPSRVPSGEPPEGRGGEGPAGGPRTWRSGSRIALWAGALLGAVAVSPPFDAWAHRAFTGHMTQHTLLIGAVGPLLALGSPVWARRTLGVGWLVVASLVHTVLVLGWHAPPLFDAAEGATFLHVLEHLCLIAGAWLLWWVAARAGGPAGWGPGALTVFVSLLPLTVLGVGLLFSGTAWYGHHGDLVDQQVGGVVMWAGGGFLALAGAVALGVAWIASSADDQ